MLDLETEFFPYPCAFCGLNFDFAWQVVEHEEVCERKQIRSQYTGETEQPE